MIMFGIYSKEKLRNSIVEVVVLYRNISEKKYMYIKKISNK